VVRAIYADVTSTVSFIVVGGADLKEAYKRLTEYYNSLRRQYEELNQTLQETNARLREAEASLQTVEAELTLTKMELEAAIAFILGLTIGATTTYVTLRRRRGRIREGG
jgi:chromosome segregation ATPase